MIGCVDKTLRPKEEFGHRCYGGYENDWIGIECLSTIDCPNGLRCCATESEARLQHCGQHCSFHEACVPDGRETCHSGSVCRADASSRSGGLCRVAAPGAQCSTVRCEGETPICRYDHATKSAECIAEASPDWFENPELAIIECSSARDCAGERCCTNGPMSLTSCAGDCMSGIDVCGGIEECPDFIGPATACVARPPDPGSRGFPEFVKTCQYRTPDR